MFSADALARLPALIQILEIDFIPEWKEVADAMIFDEIDDFSARLIQQAEQYSCPPLIDWCRAVDKCVADIDIHKLQDLSERFFVLVRNLKNIIGPCWLLPAPKTGCIIRS